MKNQKIIIVILILFIATSLTSCAPEGYSSHQYGFFSGILHGFIFVFALIGKLLSFDVGLYAEHNSGFFYWLGFIIGIGGLGGGASSSRR